VKIHPIALQHRDLDMLAATRISLPRRQHQPGRTKMSRKILSLAGHFLPLRNNGGKGDGSVRVEDVRALATEAALATAVDASPAVLVSLWANDDRLHRGDRPRRGR
jgi:hypothetical protein